MHDGSQLTPEPMDDASLSEALLMATRDLRMQDRFSAKQALDKLVPDATYTGIDVYENAIFRSKEEYFAPVTVYLARQYGQKSQNSLGMSFPGRILFAYVDGSVNITDINVDTRSYH